MFKDFKACITKGNVLNLAVAMIMGAAFGAILRQMIAGYEGLRPWREAAQHFISQLS